MAGFSKIFVIGGQGGFQKVDGVNPIQLMILVGDGNRRWFEPHYFDNSIKPLGKLRVLIPEAPDQTDSLLDACIAFSPKHFKDCPSLSEVESSLRTSDSLDFTEITQPLLAAWIKLREEARPLFGNVNIWCADLLPLKNN